MEVPMIRLFKFYILLACMMLGVAVGSLTVKGQQTAGYLRNTVPARCSRVGQVYYAGSILKICRVVGTPGTWSSVFDTASTLIAAGSNGDVQCNASGALGACSVTGTGNVARATSPLFVTPTIGAAAATSISFGGTTLATYVEGSCTLSLTFGGGSTGITYSVRTCKYQQVGNTVTLRAYLALSSKGSSTGSAVITGLPVAASATASEFQAGQVIVGNGSSYTGTSYGNIDPAATTSINLVVVNGGVAAALTDTNFVNTSNINLSFRYTIN
jgi:hypothetical protein